jgi:hypothetical protein
MPRHNDRFSSTGKKFLDHPINQQCPADIGRLKFLYLHFKSGNVQAGTAGQKQENTCIKVCVEEEPG